MIKEIINPDHIDLIRESIIILIGLIFRWIEKKKMKNDQL